MTDFQQQVGQLAPGVAGSFCEVNPRSSVIAGPGALIAGPNGLMCGAFAWVDPSGTIATNTGSGPVSGFVGRIQRALITIYRGTSGMGVPPGYEVTLHSSASFWAVTKTAAQRNQKVYASYADGSISTGPTGQPPQGASVTGSIAASTASFTGSIAGNVLTVPAPPGSGTIVAGGTLAGSGVLAGTTIVSQLTGTVGGAGTYQVSIQQTVASTALTEAYGTLTVSATASGALVVGDVLTGPSAGTAVTQFLSGSGGNGTYAVNNSQTFGSAIITASGAVETRWVVASVGDAGQLIKITTHLEG